MVYIDQSSGGPFNLATIRAELDVVLCYDSTGYSCRIIIEDFNGDILYCAWNKFVCGLNETDGNCVLNNGEWGYYGLRIYIYIYIFDVYGPYASGYGTCWPGQMWLWPQVENVWSMISSWGRFKVSSSIFVCCSRGAIIMEVCAKVTSMMVASRSPEVWGLEGVCVLYALLRKLGYDAFRRWTNVCRDVELCWYARVIMEWEIWMEININETVFRG